MSKTFAVSRYGGGSTSSAPIDTLRALKSRLSCAKRTDLVGPAERIHALIQAALGCRTMLERVLTGHDIRTETARAPSGPERPAGAATRRPSPEPGATFVLADGPSGQTQIENSQSAHAAFDCARSEMPGSSSNAWFGANRMQWFLRKLRTFLSTRAKRS
jgi:hypothetical protein